MRVCRGLVICSAVAAFTATSMAQLSSTGSDPGTFQRPTGLSDFNSQSESVDRHSLQVRITNHLGNPVGTAVVSSVDSVGTATKGIRQADGLTYLINTTGDKATLRVEYAGVCCDSAFVIGRNQNIAIDAYLSADGQMQLKLSPVGGVGSLSSGTNDVQTATGPAGGSDTCATAEAISGAGTFNFDNGAATTDGLEDILCDEFGSLQVDSDVWFAWTSDCDGDVTVTTCGGTGVDTKLAVYDDTCGGPALDCNDDDCGLQSTVGFAAVTGNVYLIRIGTFPGATGGTGTFDVGGPGCDGGGGGGDCGDCDQPNPAGDPGCSDMTCQDIVCGADTFCCDTSWDQICADAAAAACDCGGGGGGGDCGDCDQPNPAGDPGCSDMTCQDIVCGADTFCCDTSWDQICADAAAAACDCDGGGGGDADCAANLCADADAISGEGTFNFDNSAATTDGLEDILCDSFGSQQIDNDIWCLWTAPCDGTVTVQTCNGTAVDTKIAAYDGGACPTGAALACNDDTCGLQSLISFDATAGSEYLIRIGTFPGEVGGTGTFSISCPPVDLPCQLTNCQNFALDNASQSNDTGFTSADDFFCPVAGTNGALCWWGAYLPSLGADAFSVTYYMDGGGFPGGTIGGPFVQPFTLSVTGPEDTGQLVAGLAPIYEYSATHADVALGGGNCYWLEVKNNPDGGANWFWEWSFDGNNLVVVDDLGASPGYGAEDIQLGNDFAWCLDVAFDAGCVPVGADNNTCETAEAISGQGSFAFDNLFATTDGAEDILCDSFGSQQIDQDVWFCWTAPCSGEVRFETCNGTAVDTKIAVYEGCVCPTGPAIACNDDDCGLQSGLQFTAEFGNTYLLRVGTFPGAAGGAGTFSLTCIEAIENENCENAIALDVPSNTVGSTVFASASEAPACGTAGAAGAGGNVWYTVTGDGTTLTASTCPANFSDCCAANGSPGCDDAGCEATVCAADGFCCDTEWDGICAGLAADLCGDLCGGPGGTDFDTILSVYCNDCDELLCVAGNDDDCGLQSTVSWCSQAGGSYLILVHGFNGAEGNFSMDLSSDGLACTGPVTPCIPVGGCCIGADCLNGLTEAECNGAGGEYQGDGAICEGGFVGYDVQAGGAFSDISGTGTEAPVASNTDDGGDIVPLPFSFNYFGDNKTEIGVCSNGYLTFDGTLGDFTNDAIPNPAPVNDMLCPLWDDWSPNQAGTVVYQDTFGSGPDRFMAQWTDVPHFNSGGASTFQAVLFADGSIEYRYGDINIDSPTVGIENAAGDAGIDSTGTEPNSIRYQALYTDPIECCNDAPLAACNASFIPPPYGDTTGPPRNIHIAFAADSPCDLDLEVNAYIEYCGGTIPVTDGEDIRLICAGNSTGNGPCQDHSDNHGFTWIVSAWANLVVEVTDANGTTVCEQDLCAVIPQGGGNGNNLVNGRETATPGAPGSSQDDVR